MSGSGYDSVKELGNKEVFEDYNGDPVTLRTTDTDIGAYKLVEVDNAGKFLSTGCGAKIGKVLEYTLGNTVESDMSKTKGLYLFSNRKQSLKVFRLYKPSVKTVLLKVTIPKGTRYISWNTKNGYGIIQAERIIVGKPQH